VSERSTDKNFIFLTFVNISCNIIGINPNIISKFTYEINELKHTTKKEST